MAAPHRIVSLNACADPYLMVLADKTQVAALTQFARNPQLSAYPDRARSYPFTRGQAEAILMLKPDLVIASPFGGADSLAFLKGRVRILDVPPANSFADVVQQTREIAQAIGQSRRGEALIQDMTRRVQAAGQRPVGGVAVHYQRGGYIDGQDTLMDDLMTRAGLSNLARRRGVGSLGRMNLEDMVLAKPDYLILSADAPKGQDEGALLFDHPALADAVPSARRIYIPAAFTVCGGPFYPDALERMQAEVARVKRAR